MPDERREEFHAKLAEDVVFNKSNWIVELRTPVFRLVIDLDADANVEIEDSEWLLIYRSILKTLAEAYPKLSVEDRRVVVCAASIKRRTKDGVPVIKTGRHLVFPCIYVSNNIGLRLREQMMQDVSNSKVFADCTLMRNFNI